MYELVLQVPSFELIIDIEKEAALINLHLYSTEEKGTSRSNT